MLSDDSWDTLQPSSHDPEQEEVSMENGSMDETGSGGLYLTEND